MPLIVDAHQDLAWNAISFGRDYSRSAHDTRASEKDGWPPTVNGECLLGLPEYLQGQVAVIFSTLFALPRRGPLAESDRMPSYSDASEAHLAYARQLDYYARLTDEHPEFVAIRERGDLETVLASWQTPDEAQRRVGLVTLMEGADGIREPQEAEWWREQGVRIVGLAWSATRYAGGTNAPGPLTAEGRRLLSIMADLGLILDLSHASDESYLEALDRFEGVVIASHANPRACLKEPRRPERFLTDEMIRRLAERGGVMGVVPYNSFLRSDWKVSDGKTIPLDDVIKMIDHVCQVTGSAAHVGIGSDYDGGFGLASTPTEIDTVADLQKIGSALAARGYREPDMTAILSQNWIEIFAARFAGMTSSSLLARSGITIVVAGFVVFLVGVFPEAIRLDQTPGTGLLQIITLLFGITLMTLGTSIYMYATLHRAQTPRLREDIGIRLMATGVVIAYTSGLADVLGIGSHFGAERPLLGPLQVWGIAGGVAVIVAGIILYSRR